MILPNPSALKLPTATNAPPGLKPWNWKTYRPPSTAGAETTMVKGVMTDWPWLSVTVTMMGNEPGTVGVPESVPLLAKIRPAGRAPFSLQVRGGDPPAAEKLKEG